MFEHLLNFRLVHALRVYTREESQWWYTHGLHADGVHANTRQFSQPSWPNSWVHCSKRVNSPGLTVAPPPRLSTCWKWLKVTIGHNNFSGSMWSSIKSMRMQPHFLHWRLLGEFVPLALSQSSSCRESSTIGHAEQGGSAVLGSTSRLYRGGRTWHSGTRATVASRPPGPSR